MTGLHQPQSSGDCMTGNMPWHLVYCAEAGCLDLHAGVKPGGGFMQTAAQETAQNALSAIYRRSRSRTLFNRRPRHSRTLACDPAAQTPSVSLCGNKAACCCQNSSTPEDPCIICNSSATATPAQCVHTLPQIMGQQHSCLWLRAVCHRSQLVPDARYPHTGGRTRLARPSRGRALALAGMSNYAGDHQGVCLVQ